MITSLGPLRCVFAGTLLLGALSLVVASCQTWPGPTAGADHVQRKTKSIAKAETTFSQKRVNRFFYESVVPKLTTCWGKLEGRGEVQFKFTYRKKDQTWTWEKVELMSSSLSAGQNRAATTCMEQSSSGSKLGLTDAEAKTGSDRFSIYWSWPVPLPSDTHELAQMINTGGGGGIDPYGYRCKNCIYDEETHKSSCRSWPSGWVNCVEDSDGTGCQMSGGVCLFGWSGRYSAGSIASISR